MSVSAADLRNLPSYVDIAALMQHVLAESPPDDEIDTELRRAIREEYPQAEEALFTLIAEMLSAEQRMLGITRQQAAALLAKGKSEMTLSPQGTPLIRTTRVQTDGLERLSSGQREQVLKELEGALPMSVPILKQAQMIPEWDGDGSSRTALRVIGFVAALAAVFAFGYLLGRG